MTDHELRKRLRELTKTLLLGDFQGLAATTALAADRIEELKRDLNRANQRIGLFLHHAAKKKGKR